MYAFAAELSFVLSYVTVSRFDGWVTELADPVKMREMNNQQGNGRYRML